MRLLMLAGLVLPANVPASDLGHHLRHSERRPGGNQKRQRI